MKNYYEILEINQNVSQIEIKKAYQKLLRKYPPEKEEEKYKEIREAYDALRDEKSRKNYDAYFKYGREIEELEKGIEDDIKKEKYESAKKKLIKILLVAPDISRFRFKLAFVNFLRECYLESKDILEDLIIEYPENIEFLILLGKCYKELGLENKVLPIYMKVYRLEPKNPTIINEITYFFIENSKIDQAIYFLNQEINRDNSVDFEDFFAFSKLLECYIIKKDLNGLKSTIKLIEGIVPDDIESREYISWKLAKMSYTLYEAEIYQEAEEIIKLCYNLTPGNQDIKQMKKIYELYALTNKLISDTNIDDVLKGPIFFYIYANKITDIKSKASKNIDTIEQMIREYNYNGLIYMQNSIEKIKSNYSILYFERKEIYDEIGRVIQAKLNYKRGASNSSGGCYIATAVYGNYDAPEVIILRNFRDKVLEKYYLGRKFIRLYYKYSPSLAKRLKLNSLVSNYIKKILNKFVRYIENRI